MLRSIYHASGYIGLGVMALRWFLFLWTNRKVLKEAEVVVTTNAPRAFGTLFVTLDDARRLFKGRNLVFLYHREQAGQNPLLDACFSDVTVRHLLRRNLSFMFMGKVVQLPPNAWYDPMTYALTTWWLKRFGRQGVKSRCTFDIWHDLPMPDDAAALLPKCQEMPIPREGPFRKYSRDITAHRVGQMDICNELHMYAGWNKLRANVDAPPMQLPDKLQLPVHAALEKARGGRKVQLCGLHTRYGGASDKTHRDGSPLEFYIPAICESISRGYQVLVQGDRSFHPRFMETFDGMLVDAASLEVDESVFQLFCGTETDIFLGDWPVAPQLAATNGIPALIVNAWPIGWGLNGTTVYYRGIRGRDGQRWSYERTLKQGALVNCNTATHSFPELYDHNEALIEELNKIEQIPLEEDEILSAVRHFLGDLNSFAPTSPVYNALVDMLPCWTAFRVARDCRLSPAWIERHVATDLL